MELPLGDRPTAQELHGLAELIGVAVKHDLHGTGEVIQGHPEYGYLVDYGDDEKDQDWHSVNALRIDYEFYAEAKEHHLNVEHARERGIIK